MICFIFVHLIHLMKIKKDQIKSELSSQALPSPPSNQTFVATDCASLDPLLLADLFAVLCFVDASGGKHSGGISITITVLLLTSDLHPLVSSWNSWLMRRPQVTIH